MSKLYIIIVFLLWFGCKSLGRKENTVGTEFLQPNILFAIADDQSYPYTSAYGNTTVQTPHFDMIAREGILFTNAFVAAPQCSPSRAAILTGRNIWQLEEAGTHSSYFPKKFPVFTDHLEKAGYHIGYTGKPWGPGNWEDAGWDRNPVGPAFNKKQYESVPYSGIRPVNYIANFKDFITQKPNDKPFFFWYGCHEPHRVYEAGSGQKEGKMESDADVPPFLPEDSVVQNDVLDYAVEIEWFDQHLGKMINHLKEIGEWGKTIVVVTADNGMPFPFAKANLQEYGTHVPLAIGGPSIKNKGRMVKDLVSMIDLAPTFLEMANLPIFTGITGKSLLPILVTDREGLVDISRTMVLTGRERHTHARPDNLGYPARAIRTQQYLYIMNLFPDRWPAGNPTVALESLQGNDYKSMIPGYHDIDNSPSKLYIIDNQTLFPDYFKLGFEKRPGEELYDIQKDPGCIQNLINGPDFKTVAKELKDQLKSSLIAQGDPRMLGFGEVFESYPRFGRMRAFPGFRERGAYNPVFQKRPKKLD